jgi:serine O-acetyltransferase
MDLLAIIKSDYRRFRISDQTSPMHVAFFTQGFAATMNYRISRSVFLNIHIPILRQLLLGFMFLWRKLIEITTGIYLPWRAEVGAGLHISHFGHLIINPSTRMGEDCNLSQGVTIGITHGGKFPGVPQIGNRVYIGPNAVVVGGITIGNDVAIGAGAIVTKPLPDRAVAVGNPAKVISYKGSFDYIHYDGMNADAERLESFALAQA